MDIQLNENMINSLLDDTQFYKDYKAMLNEIIDQELEKSVDEMDCDLIDDCTNMLIELEQENNKDGFAVIIPTLTSERIIRACNKRNFKSLSAGMKASVVACIILLSAITCNAAVYKISGYNIAQEVAESISQKLNDWGIISLAEYNDESVDEVPTGSESHDVGFDEDEETTTQKAVTTTKQEVTGSESHDAGFDDDETTTQPEVTGSENHDAGFDDDDEPTPVTPTIANPALKQYTITFDTDGGECDIDSKIVTYRKAIGELPIPTKEGYVFAGWYNIDIGYTYTKTSLGLSAKNEVAITASTVYNLQANAVLTAKWSNACTITFDATGGECDVQTLQTNNEGKISNLPVPTREGYVFDYWYYTKKVKIITTAVAVDNDTVFSADTTLKAHWTEDKREFWLSFDANGGECSVDHIDVTYGEPYGVLPTPTYDGYTFIGWYSGKDTTSNLITSETIHETRYDGTAYALWAEDIYTANFDTDGGSKLESQELYLGQYYGNLPTPTKDGYYFEGWTYNGEDIESTDYVPELDGTKEITLVAKWSPARVDITFDGNGGEVDTALSNYYYLSTFGSLPTATYVCYELDGWYTEADGGEKVTEDTLIDFYEPTTLYAHWTRIENAVAVAVHNNRSIEEIYDLTYIIGDTLGDIPVPSATTNSEKNYTTFIGWFDDKYYGNEITADTVITEDMDIYAHWKMEGGTIWCETVLDGVKDVYMQDEEFNYDDITVGLIIHPTDGTVLDFTDTVKEDEIAFEDHFAGVNTSTTGKHTLTFFASYKEFDNLGFGTIYLECSVDYNVVYCAHSSTILVNYKAPKCNEKGYTGDEVCYECEYIVKKGTEIDYVPHDENTATKLVNQKDATCTTDGYTGDVACAVCGQTLEVGETIPKLNHPTVKLINVEEATCGEEGYTGDLKCTKCGKILEYGEVIEMLPHGELELVGVKEATCGEKGYTGDIVCSVCGEVIQEGEYIDKLPHGETEIINAVEPTCSEYGYTGDKVCKECGTIIRHGRRIALLPHAETELEDVAEPTCSSYGYTGDIVCKECREVVQDGDFIEKLPHAQTEIINAKEPTCSSLGYTGDEVCTECGEVVTKGSNIAKLAHADTVIVGAKEATCGQKGYTGDEICTVCGTVVNAGSTIAKLPHQNTVVINAKEPTCSEVGYTGDTYCYDCGKTISGEEIAKTSHTSEVVFTPAEYGKDGYSGKRCSVCGEEISGSEIPMISEVTLDENTFSYTGENFRPKVTVKNLYGYTINTFSVAYPEDSSSVGTHTVTVTFYGNYTGTYELDFVVKGDNTSFITDITRLGTGFKITWTPQDDVDGYQIQALGADGLVVQTKTVKGGDSSSTTLTGKHYATDTYVIIRTYKIVQVQGEDQKIYSDWYDPVYLYQQ
jgi:uncharacterized repeat protein (TIGR02543 family)